MLLKFFEPFEPYLSWAANIIQVFAFIYVMVSFWLDRRRYHRYLGTLRRAETKRPWAVVVSLGGGDITDAVRGFIQDQGLQIIDLLPYTYEKAVTPENAYAVQDEMVKIKAQLDRVAATEVHLFYKGPVTMAIAIGALVDNWVPVKVYEHTQGTYRSCLVLEKKAVRGLLKNDPPDLEAVV